MARENREDRMAEKRFEELEHTADAGLRVFGDDLGEILVHAAQGMFSLIGRASFAEQDLAERRWEIDYATADEALLRWLQALLLEFDLRGFFPVMTSVEAKPGRFAAVARGGTFDPTRHELRSELKAVTRHGLCVRRVPRGGLEAEVIFDL
jgi:SHS2 domain-containing protein